MDTLPNMDMTQQPKAICTCGHTTIVFESAFVIQSTTVMVHNQCIHCASLREPVPIRT